MPKANRLPAEQSPWKLLLWTTLAGLLFGLIGFGEIAEDWLRVARNSMHKHSASGDIVLVDIDDQSIRDIGRWPWPRREHARLIDQLTAAGAKRIFFDVSFFGATNPVDDQRLAQSIARSGRVVLAVKHRSGMDSIGRQDAFPYAMLQPGAQLAIISVRYNYQNAVWSIPYSAEIGNKSYPHFSALLSGTNHREPGTYTPDYSLDLDSIPTTSARNVLQGRFDKNAIRGRDVVIGATADVAGDQFFIPGTGRRGGVHVQITGAETLKSGAPVSLGWVGGLLAALGIAFFALRLRSQQALAPMATAIAIFAFGPMLLERQLVYVDVTPGLFALMIVTFAIVRRRFRARGLIYAGSGLPNLNALQAFRSGRKQAIVAARVFNYEEALATLPPNHERNLVEQIVSRLTVGDKERVIYQGDSGILAWFAEPREPFSNHLEALHALFRNPARVGNLSVDLAVSFGVELGSSRSLSSRLASALVAADEAARDGLKWKLHDPETLNEASWRLSMLSQLDSAIDKGEVWVAYQPKLELKSRRIIGCEALARWTHPEKGPIAASEFVAAAEQHNRIGKLTDFVLEQAVANASALVKRAGGEFDMAVNMSASLLTDRQFVLRLSALLARHGLDPRHLTLELTETAALASTGEGLDMIGRLRDLGIGIAIDDYGTGLSTLDYLKRVPANEIKIDQSFIKGITENRSDRLMVQSTIELAHSLGRRVVAEGAELREIVDLLVEMNCDIAQGFAIGRPMSLESLAKRISADRKRTAA